jgi:hypothetical protein
MPFICKDKFEQHVKQQIGDDNLHVQAISNPEVAAQVAALKLVMNTHLRDKLQLIETEKKNSKEYIQTIINQRHMHDLLHDALHRHQGNVISNHVVLGRGL